jgi:hypothetical protein
MVKSVLEAKTKEKHSLIKIGKYKTRPSHLNTCPAALQQLITAVYYSDQGF